MSVSEFDQIAAEVGRDVMARAAPQELPLYRSMSIAYLQSPSAIPSKSVSKDEMLGFGVAEAITYLTPVALPVLSAVLKFLADELKSYIHDQHLVGDVLKRLFNRNGPPAPGGAPSVALTREQLERVRKLAFDNACALKLNSHQASLLADSIVGTLVVSS